MSILTKIFVVLVTVFAVANVAMVIPYVNNTSHYKNEVGDLEARLKQATADAQLANDRVETLNEKYAQLNEDLTVQKGDYEGQITSLQAQLTTKQSEVIKLSGQVNEKEAQLQQVSAGTEQQSLIIATMREELESARTDTLRNQKRNTELTDQNQTLSTELETAVEQVRLLKEKLADLENQLTSGGVASDSDQAASGPAIAASNIRGVVTGVQTISDDVYVSINIGSNDQVTTGMEFMIHDGPTFIGTMVVSKVDLNSSAGRITLATGQIRTNLEVLAANF